MTIDEIRAAAARIEGHARVTPLLSSPFLDEIAGRGKELEELLASSQKGEVNQEPGEVTSNFKHKCYIPG